MTKNKAIQILRKSAENYHKNLESKNFIIIYEEEGKLKYIQMRCIKGNFLHLTGIKVREHISSVDFYKRCLNGKISEKEIIFKKDGTTELKLQILEMITNICITAKMTGYYNNTRRNLNTEFIIGTNYISLGLIKVHNNFFIPNTALKENIKNIVQKSYRIIAILSKKINEKMYNEICLYTNIKINNLEILEKVDNNIKNIITQV